MDETFKPYLVMLSLIIATLTSYTLIDVAALIRRSEETKRRFAWLLGGATATGCGLWSMNFIGMLACRIPMAFSYNLWITSFSLVIAVAAAYLALYFATRDELRGKQLALGGVLVGMGILAMQCVGMAAMQIKPQLRYQPILFLLSILIALSTFWVALWATSKFNYATSPHALLKLCGSALLMGLAIVSVHYLGMSSAILPTVFVSNAAGLSASVLAVAVTIGAICGLTMALVISKLNSRIDQLSSLVEMSNLERNRGGLVPAGTDPVTGALGRGALFERAERKIDQAQVSGTAIGLMFLDLDGFRRINDTLGFTVSDEVLRAFSEDLTRCVPAGSLVARMGGDEFLVLLDGSGENYAFDLIGKCIFDRLQKSFAIDGSPFRVTSSVGIAIYPQDGNSFTELLKNSILAMNAAKLQGKNACRVFNPAMIDSSSNALSISRSFEEALERGEFSLVYQPKFDVAKKCLVGAEALIRWVHPVMGNIPPGVFIPIAEETGQIVQISEWVIQMVCKQLKMWELIELPLVKISLNLSPEQLMQERYAERIADTITRAGTKPSTILFEITETTAMRDPKQAGEMIREFQSVGFDFSIDDFGTGHSSMAYLQQFRAKELKIDRFFINSLETGGRQERAIVSAIIGLAHALDMTVVAEGVETAYQLKQLEEMGCDEIQGYLLGRPVPPAIFEELLQNEKNREACAIATPVEYMAIT